MCTAGQPTAAVRDQQGEARSLQLELVHHRIPDSLLRQAGPMILVSVQRCSDHLCRRMMSFCMKVRYRSGSLPLKTFTYIVYWFAEPVAVFPHFLAPGLDSKSSDNLCCWIIHARWEAGPRNCWNTGAGCWSEQKQDYRRMGWWAQRQEY